MFARTRSKSRPEVLGAAMVPPKSDVLTPVRSDVGACVPAACTTKLVIRIGRTLSDPRPPALFRERAFAAGVDARVVHAGASRIGDDHADTYAHLQRTQTTPSMRQT